MRGGIITWMVFFALFSLAVSLAPAAAFEEDLPGASTPSHRRGRSKAKATTEQQKKKSEEELERKKKVYKDPEDRREEYKRFLRVFYLNDANVDKEERIFLAFKGAELELRAEEVQELEAQVVESRRQSSPRE